MTTISGLIASVVLQNNGTDNLTLTADGNFNFNTPLAHGATYAVTVLTQPAGLTCAVGSGTGTIGSANISAVNVSCSYNNLATSTATTSMGTARYSHTATLLNDGTVLVTGGSDSSTGNPITDITGSSELYDPVAKTWTPTATLVFPRLNHTATLLPYGKVLVVGGWGIILEVPFVGALPTLIPDYLGTVELYDPLARTWSNINPLATRREYHTATLLRTGKVLVVGGYGAAGSGGFGAAGPQALNSAELYDPSTGNWTATGSLTTARWFHTATLLSNGKVLVAGGTDSTGRLSTTAELYDPSTGAWTATGSLATGGRNAHTATLLPNGLVLVCGGYTGIITPTTELYDPSTGVWAGARSLAAAREFHTATLLPNGLVMISGGLGATAASLNSVEIYDPANAFMVYGGSWTSNPGSLTTSRMFHAATLMNNGEVLITGGESGTSFLPNAELFY